LARLRRTTFRQFLDQSGSDRLHGVLTYGAGLPPSRNLGIEGSQSGVERCSFGRVSNSPSLIQGQEMKLTAVIFVILASFVVGQARAQDVVAQPLTRAQCAESGMTWDDNANVCAAQADMRSGPPSAPAEAALAEPIAPAVAGQPLTRNDCNLAGMTWNESANVCGEESALGATSSILVNIDKSSQRMTVFIDGIQHYDWPVSTGGPGYSTPSGTYTASSMNKMWYSRQWDNAPMPHAVFFTREGHAIHGTQEVRRLGSPASHGCVRLAPENAAMLYALVEENGLENTQVVLAGLTPGGESKIAGTARSKGRDRADVWPQRRGGFLRRLFGRR
jgi:lipoprotein-anchoring transpeptidase ErfK/SrfK